MSATTLVDLTDAQMLDYAMDGDFSMHNSPADWLAIEATMSDDHPVSAAADYSETIEVDMDADDDADADGEITEYEMADGIGDDVDYDGDAQLQDAEFIDPQRPESSLVIDPSPALQAGEGSSLSHGAFADDHHSLLSSAEPLAATASTVAPHNPFTVATEAEEGLPQAFQALTSPPSHIETLEIASDERLPSIPAVQEEASAQADAAHMQRPIIIISAPSDDRPDEAEAVDEVSDAYESLPESVTVELPSEVAAPLREAEHEEQGDNSHHTVDHEANPHSVEQEENTDIPPSSPNMQPAEALGDEGDPHEISDGVYIDPPPTVLLSIAGSDHDDLCLFNHLSSISSSQNSEPSGSPRLLSTAPLLQQRPTLYYEPLSDVFAALRQEQYIHHISHFASFSNELMLEAYELGLTFSEDNVYTPEVTLHDLNIIHDDSHLSGPLHLRLSSSPRFIVRYRALRDQIAQMSLGAEADHSAAHRDTTDDSEQPGIADVSESEDQTPGTDAAFAQRAEDAKEDKYQAASDDHIAEHVPQVTENADTSLPAEDVEEPDTDAYDREAENDTTEGPAPAVEYGTEVTAEEATEALDSDELHRSVDAEDGGDYTDYADNVDDDDEQYGEAQPDELDGDLVNTELETNDADGQEASTDIEPTIAELSLEYHDDLTTVSQLELHPDGLADDNLFSTHSEEINDDFSEDAVDTDARTADDQHEEQYPELEGYEDGHWEPEDEESSHENDVPDDTLSKQSSETLSTLSSKRSRDDDDDDEGTLSESSPESPDSKRARIH